LAFTDTARLIASLELQDRFSATAQKAEGAIGRLEGKTGLLGGAFKGVQSLAGGAGDAFQHLTGRVGQLAGAIGLVGLGGGLIGAIGLLKSGVSEARDFGAEVSRLASVTGLTAEKTSELAGVFHHFGIDADTAVTIAGLAEKNLFRLGETSKKAGDFQAKYGLSLVDSAGKLLDFNDLLLESARFFNDPLIPAAQKAAGLAAIFGRNWQAVIPVLKANASGIRAVEEEAKRMGLTLTSANLTALSKLKNATRDWGTALSGLKLQIGLALIPTITHFTKKITSFLTTADKAGQTGSQKIVAFLKDVVLWGQKAVAFIEGNIVPGIKAAIDNWNKIPPQVRSLIFKGFAGNATISFLLGFNPVSIAASAASTIAGKLVGVLVGGIAGKIGELIGSKAVPQIVQAVAPLPVFVTNPGFGLPGKLPGPGVPPVIPPVAGPVGGSLIRTLAIGVAKWVIGPLAAAALGKEIAQSINEGVIGPIRDAEETGIQKVLQGNKLSDLRSALKAINDQLNSSNPTTQLALIVSRLPFFGEALSNVGTVLEQQRDALLKQITLQENAAAVVAHQAQERKDPLPKPLTAKELIAALAATPVTGPTGRKSILEVSVNPRRGDDPFGVSFLGVLERTTPAILKTPLALEQVTQHITELRDVTKFYLNRGDTVSAAKTQSVIEQIEKLIGITSTKDAETRAAIKQASDNATRHAASDRTDAAKALSAAMAHTAQVRALISSERTDAVQTHTKLQSLVAGWSAIHGVVSGQSGILAQIRDKPWINNNVVNTNVQVNSTISVDTLTRTFISSSWATSGRAPGSIL
jgi:hypothetical protein